MNEAKIRAGFNRMIEAAAAAGNDEAVARMEIAREYFTNPAFKAFVQDETWRINTTRH
jgi:hypothetical protein